MLILWRIGAESRLDLPLAFSIVAMLRPYDA